jgi:anti-sigma factor RsiW
MDYLDGALPADVAAALEAHVLGCERCTAFVASYRETPRIVRQATDVAMPEDVRRSHDEFLRKLSS